MTRLFFALATTFCLATSAHAASTSWEALDQNQQKIVDLLANDLYISEMKHQTTIRKKYSDLNKAAKSNYRARAIKELHIYKRAPRWGEI